MGCSSSSGKSFGDIYKALPDVLHALKGCGFEDSDMLIAFDFTRSNQPDIGMNVTFERQDLHTIHPQVPMYNPYQRVVECIGGRIARVLDRDMQIPCYGFGDAGSVDTPAGCFQLGTGNGIQGVQNMYREAMLSGRIIKSGPTSFAGVINAAIDVTRRTRRFHTLLIITDGNVNDHYTNTVGKRISPTAEAIVKAADYPIEIIAVGVGDGPWDMMESFDDEVPSRRFDNFQFVPFTQYMSRMSDPAAMDEFALNTLMELPQAFAWLQKNGMFAQRVLAGLPPPEPRAAQQPAPSAPVHQPPPSPSSLQMRRLDGQESRPPATVGAGGPSAGTSVRM